MLEAKSGGGQRQDKITDKELLTFTNLTNLSWEFVNLKAIKEGDAPVGGEETPADELSTQLKDLLIPGAFQRIVKVKKDEEELDGLEEDKYEEKREYIYGGEGYGEYNEEKGKAEMRYNAGIAMEYFEKNKEELSEASFIEDWEVIYGAEKKQCTIYS